MKFILFYLLAFLFSFSASGGGFDLHNLWSARYAGVAGAAVSSVDGSQSLFYNPAGLSDTGKSEYSLNAASGIVFNKYAPLVPGSPAAAASPAYIPILGLFDSHPLTDRLGFGIGTYVLGGSGGKFNSVDFGPQYAVKPTVQGTIIILEAAAGLGYKITPNLRIGAAWRPTFVKLDSTAAFTLGNTLVMPQLSGLTDLALKSFRFGAQYLPDSKTWGVGADLRTAVTFSAKGTTSGVSEAAGSPITNPIIGGNVTAESTIPWVLSLGAHFDLSTRVRLLTEYEFTEGTSTKAIALSGDPITISGVGPVPIASF